MSRVLIIIDGQSVQKDHRTSGQELHYGKLVEAITHHNQASESVTYYFGQRTGGPGQESFINLLKSYGIVPVFVPWRPEGMDLSTLETVVSVETYDVLVMVSSAPQFYRDLIKEVQREVGIMVITLARDTDDWDGLVDEVYTIRRIDRRHPGVIKPKHKQEHRPPPPPRRKNQRRAPRHH